jgi:hypothetical protein
VGKTKRVYLKVGYFLFPSSISGLEEVGGRGGHRISLSQKKENNNLKKKVIQEEKEKVQFQQQLETVQSSHKRKLDGINQEMKALQGLVEKSKSDVATQAVLAAKKSEQEAPYRGDPSEKTFSRNGYCLLWKKLRAALLQSAWKISWRKGN